MPINISTHWCKMTEPGMMNIYWTKIKLRDAANQAIYSDFPLGSRKFISELVYFFVINFTTSPT